MALLLVLTLVLSHALAFLPFWLRLYRGKIPNTADFATISVILFYDLGIIIELLGFRYQNQFFYPFFSARSAREDITFQAALLIIITPWVFHFGSTIANQGMVSLPQLPITKLHKSRRLTFYFLIMLISIPLALSGYIRSTSGLPLWVIRAQIGAESGTLIVFYYLPLHFLAFYVRQQDSRTKFGLCISLGLVLTSIASTLSIGQRTNLLLPFLILLLFKRKITLTGAAIFLILALALSAILLPVFKYQYSDSNLSPEELVVQVIQNDLSRGQVLTTVLEKTSEIGTKILPYPMAGYIYSGFFFVPRQIAPFKGYATATYLSSYMTGTNVSQTNWGFGIGVIEELLLNVGIWFTIPGLLLYGVVMGFLDRISRRVPSLVTPIRLAAIWLCGYNLPALLLIFGVMALVCWILHCLFVDNQSVKINSAQVIQPNPSMPTS